MGESLEEQVGNYLRQKQMKLTLAESCTGGLVGHRITNIPGSSDYYLGGVIAYANEVKAGLLGVHWETLQQYGAVSREVALEMARGVRQVLPAQVGLSVTGIAGPGGATPGKPVGLTWLGLSAPADEQAWQFIWQGDRLQNKERSAEAALQLLVNYLRSV